MKSEKQQRKYRRRTGEDVLFSKWEHLPGLDFETFRLLPPSPTPAPLPPNFDPWTAPPTKLEWDTLAQHKLEIAAREVLTNRQLIEENPAYSLKALQILLKAGVSVPDWLRTIFDSAVDTISSHSEGSIDAAFRHSKPHDSALNAARDKKTLARLAHLYVTEQIIRHGAALDNELFEIVGHKLGIGKDKARDLAMYAQAKYFGGGSLATWREPVDWQLQQASPTSDES